MYEHPDRYFATRELAQMAAIDSGNASRWLHRWAEVGLLEESEDRGRPLFRASRNPGLAPLKHLLQQDGTAATALRERLAELDEEVEIAAIFGSLAKGEAGAESDIDLLLVAPELSRVRAQAHFKPTGRELGHPVNVLLYTPQEWAAAVDEQNPLVADILSNPVVLLKGELHGQTA